jgi:hypothetical protein
VTICGTREEEGGESEGEEGTWAVDQHLSCWCVDHDPVAEMRVEDEQMSPRWYPLD